MACQTFEEQVRERLVAGGISREDSCGEVEFVDSADGGSRDIIAGCSYYEGDGLESQMADEVARVVLATLKNFGGTRIFGFGMKLGTYVENDDRVWIVQTVRGRV